MKLDRTGEIRYNTNNEKMVIVKYSKSKDIVIKFENGYLVKTSYDHFKSGYVKNLFYPSVYGVGFLGGEIDCIDDKKRTKYNCWNSMLQRCYDKNFHIKNPTYKDCTVCKEWHNFQNFSKWYDENFYKIIGEKMCLDKDILVKGNKIYSPETCIFVPQIINSFFLINKNKRNNLPVGVRLHKCKNIPDNYIAESYNKKYIGIYETPELAFQAYKESKEYFIRNYAINNKNLIPEKLYNALYNYEIKIND